MLRRTADRALMAIARAALWLLFRSVEVDGDVRLLGDRPVLVVANHFYGFIDPVLLMRVLGRLPRYLAKSTLWRSVPLRPLLRLAKMLPVQRPEDGSDAAGNLDMFAACREALARGEWVGIFPEGTTHDDGSVRTLRTGAARIALGAHAAGVEDLVVLPVGMLFDDKVALRGRVLARVGRPLEVAGFARGLEAAGHAAREDDREAVRALTAAFEQRLREAAPDFSDERQAKVLRRAAEVALRAGDDTDEAGSLRAQDAIARRIVRAGDDHVRAVTAAVAQYHLDLDIIGIGDLHVEARASVTDLLRRTVWATLRLVLAAPFAAVGLAWNIVPFVLVQLAGRAVARPIAKGSIRLSVALVVFPATWVTVALTDRFGGWLPGVAVFLVAPVLGLIGVGWLEAVIRGWHDWHGWMVLTDRRALLGDVEASRARVAAAVEAAVVAADTVGPDEEQLVAR